MENVNLVELVGQLTIENIRLRQIIQGIQLENIRLKEKTKEPEKETKNGW